MRALSDGAAQVVFFAPRKYLGMRPRSAEVVDETMDLSSNFQPHRPVNYRRGRAAVMARERVREIIDGDGPVYETARLLRRGDDGGFAERFLKGRRSS